jgi:threonine dehydrogenase-like Zn-dependent dehydrogenase
VGAKHVVITDVNDYRLLLAKEICPAAVPVNVMKENLKDGCRSFISARASTGSRDVRKRRRA